MRIMKRAYIIILVLSVVFNCEATNLTIGDIQGTYLLSACELIPELNYLSFESDQLNESEIMQSCDRLNITFQVSNDDFYITFSPDVKDALLAAGANESDFNVASGKLQIEAGSILYTVYDGKREELGIITRNPLTGDLRIINSGEISHDVNPIINLHKL